MENNSDICRVDKREKKRYGFVRLGSMALNIFIVFLCIIVGFLPVFFPEKYPINPWLNMVIWFIVAVIYFDFVVKEEIKMFIKR